MDYRDIQYHKTKTFSIKPIDDQDIKYKNGGPKQLVLQQWMTETLSITKMDDSNTQYFNNGSPKYFVSEQ